MLKERLQILVTRDQRRRLEREAQRRGTSVAGVIRDAVDAQLGEITVEDRRAALDDILTMRGRSVSPDELDRIAEGERVEQLEAIVDGADGRTSPPVLEEVWHIERSGRLGRLDGLAARAHKIFSPLL